MASSSVLHVKRISKQFHLHEQNKLIPSSTDVNLEVDEGSLTALIGPTSAGKSSVLKGIYRTYIPTTGEIWYTTSAGERLDLAQANEHQVLSLRRNEIGFVTQFLHFLPRQATVDVVAQPLIEKGENVSQANW